MQRKWTIKFKSDIVRVFQKKHQLGFVKLIDFGEIDLNVLFDLIYLGNFGKPTYEETGERIDKYIENTGDSYLDIYFDLLKEVDADTNFFRKAGVDIDEIKADYLEKVEEDKTKRAKERAEKKKAKAEQNKTEDTQE